MTIRTRLTLWYAGVLLLSILLITVLSLNEFHERHRGRRSEQGMEEIVEIVLWISIPAALLSVGGGWWLMRKALAPVAALTQAAERINERNLSEQLPRTRNGDEFDRLTEVLNRMTARLHESFTRIREFTLHASHELKTPLTILCGETETELRDELLAPAQREHCASQLEELRRLARIVDGLTLLAKADAGLITLALTPVHLDEIVRDGFADAQILAQASGIRVELTACEELTVPGDGHRLRQLLLNLVDNAVKYNQAQGSMTLSLHRADNAAELIIGNTGPGIPPEILPRVFDRFFRGDPAHGGAIEGCGLGLSIAQWIVSAHNGSIKIESMSSQMTTVTVRLPLERETNANETGCGS
jgi:signal transduction histidine kinase